MNIRHLLAVLILPASLASTGMAFAAEVEILNVSYDPTREMYREFNEKFSAQDRKSVV